MDSLPKELKNIIFDYQVQLNYSKCLDEINNIDYVLKYNSSFRNNGNVMTSVYYNDETHIVNYDKNISYILYQVSNYKTVCTVGIESYIESDYESESDSL